MNDPQYATAQAAAAHLLQRKDLDEVQRRVLQRLRQESLTEEGESTAEQYLTLLRFLRGLPALDAPNSEPDLLELLLWAAEAHVLHKAEAMGDTLAGLLGEYETMHPANQQQEPMESLLNMITDARIHELLVAQGFLAEVLMLHTDAASN